MTHRILLSTLVIDAPAEVRDRTVEFWAAALGAERHRHPDAAVPHPPRRGRAQPDGRAGRRHRARPGVHIDIHTDDLEAEVQRLTDCGADASSSHGPTTPAAGW